MGQVSADREDAVRLRAPTTRCVSRSVCRMTTPQPSPALDALAGRLHVDVERVAHLGRLGETTLQQLTDLVGSAQARDDQAIEEALQQTVRFVPKLLRGRAKKMLFPEER